MDTCPPTPALVPARAPFLLPQESSGFPVQNPGPRGSETNPGSLKGALCSRGPVSASLARVLRTQQLPSADLTHLLAQRRAPTRQATQGGELGPGRGAGWVGGMWDSDLRCFGKSSERPHGGGRAQASLHLPAHLAAYDGRCPEALGSRRARPSPQPPVSQARTGLPGPHARPVAARPRSRLHSAAGRSAGPGRVAAAGPPLSWRQRAGSGGRCRPGAGPPSRHRVRACRLGVPEWSRSAPCRPRRGRRARTCPGRLGRRPAAFEGAPRACCAPPSATQVRARRPPPRGPGLGREAARRTTVFSGQRSQRTHR